MKLLPFESYVIETPSLVSELVSRLQSHTERPRFIRWERPNSDFVGWVSDDEFRVRPVFRSGASFVPELYGRFVHDADGTHVLVEVIPSSAALAVIALLAGLIGMMVFYSGPRAYLAIISGIVLAWAFGMLGFWLEAGKTRPMLLEILSGESDVVDSTLTRSASEEVS